MTGLKAVTLLWKFSLSLVALVGFALDVHTHKRFLYVLLYQQAIAMRFPESIAPRLACSVLPHRIQIKGCQVYSLVFTGFNDKGC